MTGGSVTYMQPAAGSLTYAAAEPVGAPMMTYGAPATYAAPVSGQPVYTISPERFQLILQGQPLTNEEIAAMTGQGASAAVPVQTAGASFAMPDMFSSPGLTNVYAATGEAPPAAASAVVETAVEAVAPATTASAKKEKKSSKKSSKKKLSSKKKEKGCC